MKTLKKSLCLVLALVMVLSLCAFSASADLDYEDADSIYYDEAVDVMSIIGVLEGYTDGTFLPKQQVTREEAAKIIAYLMVGDAKEADALKTTVAPFSDVAADRWSAGYIAYLVSEGVLDGVGNGKFDPTATVTGLQFAKMLLTALGYGVNDEYVGANWAINVAKDALQYGIFDTNLAGANNEAATREECALYAFNTLYLSKVTYSALLGGYIENNWNYSNAESNKYDCFAYDFGLEQIDLNEDDDYVRPVGGYYWQCGKKTSAVYGGNDALAVYTTAVTYGDIYSLVGKSVAGKIVAGTVDVEMYVDGVEETYTAANTTKGSTTTVAYTGNGAQTYIYKIDAGTYRICVVNTYLAKVTKVQAETAKLDAYINVTLADAFNDTTYDAIETESEAACTDYPVGSIAAGSVIKCEGITGYAEDEYVLVGIADVNGTATFESITSANIAEAEITQVDWTQKSKTYTIYVDGVKQSKALVDFVIDDDDMVRADSIDKEYVDGSKYYVFTDNYGYIIGIMPLEDNVKTDYVYVAAFGVVHETSGLSTKYVLKADVYYADGTNQIVTVAKYTNDKQAITFDILEAAAEHSEDGYVTTIGIMHADGLYTIKVKANGVELAKPEKTNPTNKLYTIAKVARLTVDGVDVNEEGINYCDNDTIYFAVSGEYGTKTFAVDVITGYKNMFTCTGTQVIRKNDIAKVAGDDAESYYIVDAAVVYGDADNVTTLDNIYIWNGNYTKGEEQIDVFYTLYKLDGTTETLHFVYDDAEICDAYIADNTDDEDPDGNTTLKWNFIKVDSNGVFYVYDKDVIETEIIDVYTNVGSFVVADGSNNSYSLDGAQVFFATSATKLAAGQKILMIADGTPDWTAKYIIVVG